MRNPDIDAFGERLARHLADRTSRRSVLGRLGTLLVAAPVIPLLPMQRASAAQPKSIASQDAHSVNETDFSRAAQTHDETACNYWRYCGVDGNMCACCGGGIHSCPPGSQPSPTAWIGSCINPEDRRTYLIAYRDCCGASTCGHCSCVGTDHAMPIYRPQTNNHIIWCIGTSSMEYHCSMAVLVGLADGS
jgi:methylamine dehydrogenase light chain